MLNCKQATQLMSRRMDKKLGWLQATSLRLHFMICEGCRNFNHQMEVMREAMQKISRLEE
jgi:hypothetical protein